MSLDFKTDLPHILNRVQAINPAEYARTRNYVNGSVTYLSPYISRGVISTKQVLESIIARNLPFAEAETLVRELGWRDYFQRVWQHKNINLDIKNQQQNVAHFGMPKAVLVAKTGILGIDESIEMLYKTGYMHNHCRMYVAAVACNIGRAHWLQPARWMYYHLLDADWASNTCSWQWVAGSNSSKKYFANQENISKFTQTPLHDSFLNQSYEALAAMEIPEILRETDPFKLETKLPPATQITIDTPKPTLLYTYYNLDPQWHSALDANRILLLEPSVFAAYPVGEKPLNFALQLAQNIANIQIFVGEFAELKKLLGVSEIRYKEHPLSRHFSGIEESRDWMVPSVDGYYGSFFGYWNQVEKTLRSRFNQ
jgi:deoxyribodipyrimidine photo-lyase